MKMNLAKVFYIFFCLFQLSKCLTVSEYPKWRRDCSFKRYVCSRPSAFPYYNYTSSVTTEAECESLCSGDTRCGMYRWKRGANWCARIQHSVNMWEKAGIPVEEMMRTDLSFNTGSKMCKEEVIPPACGNYIYINLRIPSSGWFTSVYTNTESLTPDMCKNLCNMYSLCKSVVYLRYAKGYNGCLLYSTTINDGGEQCRADYTTCGTYHQRQC